MSHQKYLFAKIFDFKDHQVLVTLNYDSDSRSYEIVERIETDINIERKSFQCNESDTDIKRRFEIYCRANAEEFYESALVRHSFNQQN
jgi:hypothetical protein